MFFLLQRLSKYSFLYDRMVSSFFEYYRIAFWLLRCFISKQFQFTMHLRIYNLINLFRLQSIGYHWSEMWHMFCLNFTHLFYITDIYGVKPMSLLLRTFNSSIISIVFLTFFKISFPCYFRSFHVLNLI